jgi:SAM-dependent MidA family methyltransferase
MPRDQLPEPPNELKQLSLALLEAIRSRIETEGPIPFSSYMEMALYEPGLGYYCAGLHKLGKSGDFVTAPELGTLFAGCLARQLTEIAAELGEYDILEIGAGTGKLAGDLFCRIDPAHKPRRYRILERSADLRQVQRETIAQLAPKWLDRVEWLDRPPQSAWTGVLLANEVIDALAVERFRLTGAGPEQACVSSDGRELGWVYRPAPESLAKAICHLRLDLPHELSTGYRSEINLHLAGWLDAISANLERGVAFMIDYGYPRSEYYHPQRTDGTLICHYRHRAHEDVFYWPGLQDMTAFVDFTALAESADSCGLALAGYTNQAMFLLGCGLDEELAVHAQGDEAGMVAANAQARQLTLPGMMGERFQVMGLSRGFERPLRGFSMLDLTHRL